LTVDSAGVNGAISFKTNGSNIMRIHTENINFYDKELRNVQSIKYEDNTEQFTAFTEEHLAQLNSNNNASINADITAIKTDITDIQTDITDNVKTDITNLRINTTPLTYIYFPPVIIEDIELTPELKLLNIDCDTTFQGELTTINNLKLKSNLNCTAGEITSVSKLEINGVNIDASITEIKTDITNIQTDITDSVKADVTNIQTNIADNVKADITDIKKQMSIH
jgi:hypothetical protein